MEIKFLRRHEVSKLSALGRSSLYARIAQGLWPRQVSIGPRAVAWPANEVEAINSARIRGDSDDKIRVLVAQLMAARRGAK